MQQANQKTAEPSMEDILASIRKIIAEEPASPASTAKSSLSGPAASPPPVSAQASAAITPPPRPPAPQPAAPQPPVRQVDTRPATSHAGPKAVSASAPTRLSDIMREFAPAAVPLSAPTIVSFHDDLDDLVEGDAISEGVASPAAVASEELLVPQSNIKPSAFGSASFPALDRGDPAGLSEPTNGTRPADLGAFVPMNRDAFSSTQRVEQAPEFKLPEFNRVERGPALAGAPESVPLPVAMPLMPLAAKTEDATNFSASEPVVETGADDAVAAAQSALGALALGLAAPSSSMVVTTPQPEPVAMQTAAQPRRQTLDDAVVEMLRPMVREWLDAHLPEMVEQALRLEMADSLKRSN